MTSVDGKITGSFMETKSAELAGKEYERINAIYKPQAWLCGRVTTEENFTYYRKPQLEAGFDKVPEGDYIAVNDAPMYYISIDAAGKIGWQSNTLKYEERPEAHIVEILSEKASEAYKGLLRKLNISYIIAGKERLDCKLATEKLYQLFGIKTLMLSGGGYINGSFLNEGLIDELSLIIIPVTDSRSDTVSLFEQADYLPAKPPVEFSLQSVEKLEGDAVWLRYKIKNK